MRKRNSSGNNNRNNNSGLTSNTKIEIIHNVDGYENVFKTNKTFDLNEIVVEKNRMHTRFNSSDNCLVEERRRENIHSLREFKVSKQNYNNNNNLPPLSQLSSSYRNCEHSFLQEQNKHYTIYDTNYEHYYDNDKVNIKNAVQSNNRKLSFVSDDVVGSHVSVDPKNERDNLNKINVIDDEIFYVNHWSESNVSTILLIESWMTSLRQTTIDYNENTICNTKSIPSRNCVQFSGNKKSIDEMGTTTTLKEGQIFNENNNNKISIEYNNNNKTISNDNSESDTKYGTMINQFKSVIIENESRLRRLPPKPPRRTTPVQIKWNSNINYKNNKNTQNKLVNNQINIVCLNNKEPTHDNSRFNINQQSEQLEKQKQFQCNSNLIHEQLQLKLDRIQHNDNNAKNNTENVIGILNTRYGCKFIDISMLETEIVLSVAYNKIIITYDHILKNILHILSHSSERSKVIVVQNNLQKLLIHLWETVKEIQKNKVNKIKTAKYEKKQLDDFMKSSRVIPTYQHKIQIEDFEKKSPTCLNAPKCFMDFELKANSDCIECTKTSIDDYVRNSERLTSESPKLNDLNKPKNCDINYETFRQSIPNTDDINDENEPSIMEEKLILRRGNHNSIKLNNRRANLLWNIRNSDNEENIYQQIWNCKTIGSARESYSSIYEDTNNFNTDETDDGDWEVADEFSFHENTSTPKQSHSTLTSTEKSEQLNSNITNPDLIKNYPQFDRVHIYYNETNPKLNHIIYNIPINNINPPKLHSLAKPKINLSVRFKTNFDRSKTSLESIPACVISWQLSLRNFSLLEDEEDMVSLLIYTFLLHDYD